MARTVIKISSDGLYLNGSKAGNSWSGNWNTGENKILIGAVMQGNKSVSLYSSAKFYGCRIWENGVLIRSFIPCQNIATEKYGMYDVINNTFYVSDSGTDFTGPSE